MDRSGILTGCGAGESHLSDEIYVQKHGATDSELIFLLMLEFGLESDPVLAMKRMVGTIVEEAVRAGVPPFLRLTAAFRMAISFMQSVMPPMPLRRRSIRRRWAVYPASVLYPSRLMVRLPTGWLCRQTVLSPFPGRAALRLMSLKVRFLSLVTKCGFKRYQSIYLLPEQARRRRQPEGLRGRTAFPYSGSG